MYLQKMNGYSDYETSYAAMALDIGNVLGGVLIGYFTDLMYSRRTPLALLSILLSTLLQVLLITFTPENRLFFIVYIFFLGLFNGGAIAIISGISCADLGKLKQLSSNEKSMGTVVGIIDGTGSLGAAFGQLAVSTTRSNCFYRLASQSIAWGGIKSSS